MKYRYLSVFLLVLIFAIGAVSAQDNATDVDVISAASDDVISVDSNVDTLQNESGTQEIHLNDANFADYFDENGTMNDNVSDYATIYVGDITNKSLYINKQVNVLPDNVSNIVDSTFSFVSGGDYSTVKGLTITNAFQSGIGVMNAVDVSVVENVITILGNANSTGVAIFAMNATNVGITGNTINYNGKNDGYTLTTSLSVFDSDSAVIEDNKFNITIPSAPVEWDEISPSVWVSSPLTVGIEISNSDNVKFNKNAVLLTASDIVGDSDTIYVLDIEDSDNADVEDNEIAALGHTYIYGMVISGDDFTVSNNNISVESDTFYANGIDVEGPASGQIENNTISIVAPTAAYGIYSAMSNGDVSVDYTDNVIAADAFAAYGMELAGELEIVVNADITLNGNFTTGIASKSKQLGISKSTIIVNGSSVGNTSDYWDAFAPNTVALNLYDSSAMVISNIMDSTSSGIIVESGEECLFEDNIIVVIDNGQIDSVGFMANSVNGLNFTDNFLQYVGNTSGVTENTVMLVTESNGTFISNNEIFGDVISLPFTWNKDPDGNWIQEAISNGLVFYDDDEIEITDNNITIEYIDAIGAYDTIYALEVDSSDALVENNNINVTGHSYIYGIVISGEELTVSYNNISVASDAYYANGINVEGPASGEIYGNNINVVAPTVAYPVYSAMSNGEISVGYSDNIITALSDVVFGMALAGESESVSNNEITLNGNYTTGIASKTKDLTILDNTIIVNGTNLGNTSSGDAYFEAYTLGIVILGSESSESVVSGNMIKSTSSGVLMNGGKSIFVENEIFVEDTGIGDSAGLYAFDMDGIHVDSNLIDFVGNTDSENKNVAVFISNCNETSIEENQIFAEVLANDVDWTTGECPSSGVVLYDNDGVQVLNNTIVIGYGNFTGYYDTIRALDVKSDNAVIDGNNILAGGNSYLYALVVSGENFTVSNNEIIANADFNQATGIDVEGPASGVVENNTVTVAATVAAYPIYSSGYTGDIVADYLDNVIEAEADVVYGMELMGTNETAQGNTITVEGNKTIGIAGSSDNLIIMNNKIDALGENLQNAPVYDVIAPETTGVKIVAGNATVEKNTIYANGQATVNITDVDATVVYNYLVGNETFGDASVYFDNDNATVHDNLPDYDAFLQTEDIVLYYKNGTRFVAKVTNFYGEPLENQTVEFFINGVAYTKTTNKNGTASLAINLEAGNYSMLTTLHPPANKTPIQAFNNVTVLTTIYGDDLVKMFRNGSQYYATFLDGKGNPLAKGTMVKFNIHGVMYERKTNENGTAKLNINLEPGEYIITATNPVNGEQHSNLITVLALIESQDLVKYYRNASQFVVTIMGDDGNPVGAGETVTFNINGVFYTRTTNASGQAKLNINLQPGDYIITSQYKNCSVSQNITVLPVLTANDIVIKAGTSDQFIAYLVDGQGNPYPGQTVNFNLYGVLYDRTTDADGRAILDIKITAAADTYIVTSSYNGTSISNTIKIEP